MDEFPKVVKNYLLARFLGQIKCAPSSSRLWCGYKGWQVFATMCRSWEQYPWIGKLGWRSFLSRKVTEKGMYDITRITLFTLPGKGYARVWLSLGLRSKKSPGLKDIQGYESLPNKLTYVLWNWRKHLTPSWGPIRGSSWDWPLRPVVRAWFTLISPSKIYSWWVLVRAALWHNYVQNFYG